jgi:hypothetical protein
MTTTQNGWAPVARRLWLWPVAILVSFPIGGGLADTPTSAAPLTSARFPADGRGATGSGHRLSWLLRW